MSHRCSIGFKSGKCDTQAVVSCLHHPGCLETLATWDTFPSDTHRSQGTTGYDVCTCLQSYAFPDHHWLTTKPVMLDLTDSKTFTTLSPDSFSRLSHVISVNLLIYGQCPVTWPVNSGVPWQMPIELHDAGLWVQVVQEEADPHAALMKAVSDRTFYRAETAHSTNEQKPVLLLGCCLSMALTSFPNNQSPSSPSCSWN